jgi:hypothetical protein
VEPSVGLVRGQDGRDLAAAQTVHVLAVERALVAAEKRDGIDRRNVRGLVFIDLRQRVSRLTV